MSKFLAGIAALTLVGTASMPIQASAAEHRSGAAQHQSTEVSAQRHWRRHHGYRTYGPRHYYGPRYGYYGPRYGYYGYPRYAYPYGYGPGIGVGIGPFGFRVF